ncbi:hypothetical protein E2C01_010496 [Portunus trituberculatus]|uniref:Uncharacterized protein n=1 Tax=Portunus trituberculatus TaxID=210409 RepID=A0A5B7D8T7_PORTR|nr:hypothetical protein [Portunus trituberculatus]
MLHKLWHTTTTTTTTYARLLSLAVSAKITKNNSNWTMRDISYFQASFCFTNLGIIDFLGVDAITSPSERSQDSEGESDRPSSSSSVVVGMFSSELPLSWRTLSGCGLGGHVSAGLSVWFANGDFGDLVGTAE